MGHPNITAHQASSSLELSTMPVVAENSESSRLNERPSAVSSGLKTEGAPFTTVTSAFYSHSEHLNSTEIAVWDLSDDRTLTYRDLASRAENLAKHLESIGVGRGWKIPLVATRGLESVIAILAVLSCGAQFIPVDYEIRSSEYLRKTVEWSGQNVVQRGENVVVLSVSPLTDDILSRVFPPPSPVTVVGVHSTNTQSPTVKDTGSPYFNVATADDVCYTVFTSGIPPGNSGREKEVRVKHRSLVNLVCLPPGNLGIQRRVRVGQLLSIGTDLASWEIFGCLCNGGTLLISGHRPERAFQEIEVYITTPTILARYVPEQFPNLKIVASVGEGVPEYLADEWATHVNVFWNCYGLSETTIVSIMSPHHGRHHTDVACCDNEKLPSGCPTLMGTDGLAPIGSPIPNTCIYVLDDVGGLRSSGLPGTIWVGGHGVSSDYVGYTADCYMPNPFLKDGSYIYRTGGYGLCKGSTIELGAPVLFGHTGRPPGGFSEIELQKVASAVKCVAGSNEVAKMIYQSPRA